MLKIAVPSNDGEQISPEITKSLVFLIYETRGREITSRTMRARIHGLLAAVGDCSVVIGKGLPDPVRQLLAAKGIRALEDSRGNADRAVTGFLHRRAARRRGRHPLSRKAVPLSQG